MKEKFYSIAIRKRNQNDYFFEGDDFQFTEVDIKAYNRYWLADPFLFDYNGNTYIFYEAYDLYIKRGVIGYSVIDEQGKTTPVKVILKKKYHLSFPFVFEKDGNIYMMPECCGADKLLLFRAKSFPDKWEECQILLDDVFMVDSIQFRKDDDDYLLCSEQYRMPPKGKIISCWVKNWLFSVKNLKDNSIDFSEGKIIAEGDDGIRNGGKIFEYNGDIIRVGQDCTDGMYGRGIKFFTIKSLQPYEEKINYCIDFEKMQSHIAFIGKDKKLIGMHTYNMSDMYEIIDFSYIREIPFNVKVLRCQLDTMKFVYHKLKALISYICKCKRRVEKRLLHQGEEIYKSEVAPDKPWVFVSYIADVFYHREDTVLLNSHQNKREALAMERIFNEMGYNVYFMNYNSTKELPDIDCKLVFGHEPNFVRACNKYSAAKKIYYGVSTYFKYRNEKIISMTDYFNEVFHANVPYRRLVEPNESVKIADEILLIGSKNTIRTYPEEFQSKITLIHQSIQECPYVKNIYVHGKREFLFMGGSGNVFKGLGSVIEYFSGHSDIVLHWIGPIEPDEYESVKRYITPNILRHGYLQMGSSSALGIMERCDFMIYPSGVEGVPGAVLNGMKNGLIPLVTPWALADGIEDIGYVMKDVNVDSVAEAVDWALSLTNEEILLKKKKSQDMVRDNYTIEHFAESFEEYMQKKLGGYDCSGM